MTSSKETEWVYSYNPEARHEVNNRRCSKHDSGTSRTTNMSYFSYDHILVSSHTQKMHKKTHLGRCCVTVESAVVASMHCDICTHQSAINENLISTM